VENELKTPLCSQPSATYSPPISPDGGIARFFPLRPETVHCECAGETRDDLSAVCSIRRGALVVNSKASCLIAHKP
jgi:hypothetical protein